MSEYRDAQHFVTTHKLQWPFLLLIFLAGLVVGGRTVRARQLQELDKAREDLQACKKAQQACPSIVFDHSSITAPEGVTFGPGGVITIGGGNAP